MVIPFKDTQEGEQLGSNLAHGPGCLETMAVAVPVVSAALYLMLFWIRKSAGCTAQMEYNLTGRWKWSLRDFCRVYVLAQSSKIAGLPITSHSPALRNIL